MHIASHLLYAHIEHSRMLSAHLSVTGVLCVVLRRKFPSLEARSEGGSGYALNVRTTLYHILNGSLRVLSIVEGCGGLPQVVRATPKHLDTRPWYHIELQAASDRHGFKHIRSSKAQEGIRSLRGTVQWDEALDL